ncbi:hypothetical protein [uncultured Brevundimonas sp.]
MPAGATTVRRAVERSPMP